jgi:hypothetical protein
LSCDGPFLFFLSSFSFGYPALLASRPLTVRLPPSCRSRQSTHASYRCTALGCPPRLGIGLVVCRLGRLLGGDGVCKSSASRPSQHPRCSGSGPPPVTFWPISSLLISFPQELKHYIAFLVPTERYVAALGWSIAIFATWKPFVEDRSIDQDTSHGNGRILFYWFRVRPCLLPFPE